MSEDVLSGGREPDPVDDRPPRSGPPRRWPTIVVVVVVLLAAVGLALHHVGLAGLRAAPAPTPTIGSPSGDGRNPAAGLAGRIDLRLLVLGAAPISYDLLTGRQSTLDTGPSTDPGSVQAAVALADGDVLAFTRPGGFDANRPGGGEIVLGCRTGHAPVSLGTARAVLDAYDGRTVWLVGSHTTHGSVARRVTLTGQPVGSPVRVPTGDVVAATDGGQDLVVSVGAGRAQRLQVLQGGTRTVVATDSELVAASSSTLLVRSFLTGALHLYRPDTSVSRSLPLLLPGAAAGPATLSAVGSTVAAVVRTGNGTISVAAGPSDGRPLSIVPGTRMPASTVDLQLSTNGALVLDLGHRTVLIADPAIAPEHIDRVRLPEFATTVAY